MELLAPAGNEQALFQAVAHGADAVYLGYTAFSARASAGNFTEDELTRAVKLCHLHSVRVYVTVNTLVKEAEIPALLNALHIIHAARADAVIVQDVGAARLIRKHFPGLTVHASTQMALHNVQGVRFARDMGIKRVVLGRECPLSEVKLCCQEGIEIEVFVHGAMCISQSGECLFSSMVGGRSGNRGRCAQPCRMQYTFEGKRGAFLSPRDMLLLEDLDALEDAGVSSVKIEGRLKRPEYVAAVVSAYRRALDGHPLPREQEKEQLLQVFNRGGFMRGHMMGDEDAAICYPERVNHQGLPLGQVTGFHNGMARITLERDLNDGDGLQFRGREDVDAVYSGKALKAGETALCRVRDTQHVKVGTPVARLTDNRQMQEVMLPELPKIPVDMALRLIPGQKAELTIENETVYGETVQAAQSAALSADKLKQIMEKTGGTDFEVRQITLDAPNAFMPVAQLNQLRRNALERYADFLADRYYEAGRFHDDAPAFASRPIPKMTFQKAIRGHDPAFFEDGALNLYEPLSYDDAVLDKLTRPAWLCLPTMAQTRTLDEIIRSAEKRADTILGLVMGSIGQLGARTSLPIAAGEGVPVCNCQSAQALCDLGCTFLTASPELAFSEISALKGFPLVVPVYGRTRLMTLSHCPRRTAMGLSHNRADCRMCDAKPLSPLYDRMNIAFPMQNVRLPEGCRIHILNSVPLNLLGQEKKLLPLGFTPLYAFTTEEEAVFEKGTAGHFSRPVE